MWIEFNGLFDQVSYNEFDYYVSSCIEKGFNIEATQETNEYTAFNNEGYYLKVSYRNGEMDIRLRAPLRGDPDFSWPTIGLATKIPEFIDKTGTIEINNEEKFEVNLFDVSLPAP